MCDTVITPKKVRRFTQKRDAFFSIKLKDAMLKKNCIRFTNNLI